MNINTESPEHAPARSDFLWLSNFDMPVPDASARLTAEVKAYTDDSFAAITTARICSNRALSAEGIHITIGQFDIAAEREGGHGWVANGFSRTVTMPNHSERPMRLTYQLHGNLDALIEAFVALDAGNDPGFRKLNISRASWAYA